ncbi:hypothetical protein HPP92_001850 [Vanilla planifolia]|uniref:BZIP domain-containing protein n=1 Tax=Vanilla planifolia TaxID=51239 RepID=A0A835RWZ9_VANPL|nr:hypothetical protein HPP92_001850 [Vanilla planifolia]
MDSAASVAEHAAADLRRFRRMVSNREAARRSRLRKQRQLEDLRSRVGRLRLQKRTMSEHLASVSVVTAAYLQDNDRLAAEFAALRSRLSDIRRVIFLRQLQRLSVPPLSLPAAGTVPRSANEPLILSSLMT